MSMANATSFNQTIMIVWYKHGERSFSNDYLVMRLILIEVRLWLPFRFYFFFFAYFVLFYCYFLPSFNFYGRFLRFSFSIFIFLFLYLSPLCLALASCFLLSFSCFLLSPVLSSRFSLDHEYLHLLFSDYYSWFYFRFYLEQNKTNSHSSITNFIE